MADNYPVPESAAENRVSVSYVGQVTFDFMFQIERPEQLSINYYRLDGTVQPLSYPNDFTVSGIGDHEGGTYTLKNLLPVVGEVLGNYRLTPIERRKDWQNAGDYKADLVNDETNHIYQIMQENRREGRRSLKLPIGETAKEFPRLEDRAGKYLSFDDEGNPAAIASVHDVSIVAGISDAIVTVSGVAPQVVIVADIEDDIRNVSAIRNDVKTVSEISGDVVEVVEMRPEIQAVISDKTNIGIVAGNTPNINKVADADAEIRKVAAIDTDVSKVAAIDTDVTLVSSISADVQTVAGDRVNINAVADNKANIDTVAGSKTNIDAVAANKPNIDAVAGNADNINNVAVNKTNIDKVAANEVRINSVAANEENINAVSGNATNINIAAAHAAEIDTVSSNIAKVVIVSDNMGKVSTVALISNDVSAVADIQLAVQAVAAIGEDVEAVAQNIASVVNVAGNKTNIDIVALNIADIQNASQNMADIKAAPDAATRSETAAGDAENYRDEALAVFANMKGGLAGYVLVKNSDDDYDYTWLQISGLGDMLKSAYDPTGVNGDAFNTDNMYEGSVNAVLTIVERNRLATIPTNANNTNATTVGAALAAPTPSTSLVDGDKIGGVGSGGAVLKTWSWATIKAGIKAFTDTLYATAAQGLKADGAIRFDVAQSLGGVEQQKARDNMFVPSRTDTTMIYDTLDNAKLDKTAQAADSAKLGGKTEAQLPFSGVGQTWQDFTAARVRNTAYQNSTGKPISVSIRCTAGTTTNPHINFSVSIDNINWLEISGSIFDSASNVGWRFASMGPFMIPNGCYYRFDSPSLAHQNWLELR